MKIERIKQALDFLISKGVSDLTNMTLDSERLRVGDKVFTLFVPSKAEMGVSIFKIHREEVGEFETYLTPPKIEVPEPLVVPMPDDRPHG